MKACQWLGKIRSLTWRFEASRCHILAARMPGRRDLPVHPSTDSVSSWALVKRALVVTGKDPRTKAEWVQESKAPAEVVNGQPALFQGSACHERNPHSLRPIHHPMVQTAVTCGEGAASLESEGVPQLCISRVTLCFLNSYKRKTVPFLPQLKSCLFAPELPGRRSALSKMFLTSLLTSPKYKV